MKLIEYVCVCVYLIERILNEFKENYLYRYEFKVCVYLYKGCKMSLEKSIYVGMSLKYVRT